MPDHHVCRVFRDPFLRRIVPVILCALAVLALSARFAVLLTSPGDSERIHWAQQDFRDAVYYPSVAVSEGVNPYNITDYLTKYPVGQHFPPYSPLTLAVHLPFAVLSFRDAAVCNFVLTIGLTFILSGLVLFMCGHKVDVPSLCLLSGLTLCSRPGHWNALLGQTTLELVIGAYAALYFARSRPWISALGIALVSLKPTFGLPVLLLLVAGREFRAVLIGVVLTAALTAPMVAVLSGAAGGFDSLVKTMWEGYTFMVNDPSSNAAESPVRLDAVALASRVLGRSMGPIADVLVLVVGIGLAGVTMNRLRHFGDGRGVGLYTVALVSLTVLVSAYQLAYSALLLILPITALALGDWKPPGIHAPPQVRLMLLALLSVPMANYGASYFLMSQLGSESTIWIAIASVNGLALLAAYSVYVLLPFLSLGKPRDGRVL